MTERRAVRVSEPAVGVQPREALAAVRESIAALCRLRAVASLHLIGSTARGDWHGGSDVDLVVTFSEPESDDIADRYLALARDLEALLGRHVDLITDSSIRNPYLRRSIEQDRQIVYEA